MKLFLDIDGVLLGIDHEKSHRAALADHALVFLEFALAHFEVYWLTTHCRGDAQPAIDHIIRHTKLSDRERLLDLVSQIRVSDYETFKTDGLPTDEPFVWLDDAPTQSELQFLRERDWLDRWLWVDTREDPEDLIRARTWLEARLARMG